MGWGNCILLHFMRISICSLLHVCLRCSCCGLMGTAISLQLLHIDRLPRSSCPLLHAFLMSDMPLLYAIRRSSIAAKLSPRMQA